MKSTLFIDESGKSSLKEKYDNPFIITGVILNDEEIIKIEGYFEYIKRKFDISLLEPFHSYHIYEEPNQKLSEGKALKLSQNLADFLSLIPINIRVLAVNKSEFRKALGITSLDDFKGSAERKSMCEFPYEVMASKLFCWFAEYLKKEDRRGNIVVDSRVGGDIHLLNTLDKCKDPDNRLDPGMGSLIKERCGAISFAQKNYMSGGLEITDLISYVSFFKVRRLISSMKNIGMSHLADSIKEKMDEGKIITISNEEVQKYFGISEDGFHKYLK